MDVSYIRIFVRACVNFGIRGYLSIDNEELIEFYKECLIVARCFEDDPTVSRLYFQLGHLNVEMGFTKEALHNYEECLIVADKIDDESRKLKTFIQKGKVYMDLKKKDEAIECFLKGLNISKETRDKERERDCSLALGWVYCETGKQEEAIAHHERYLCITLQIGDEKEKLEAYKKSGIFYDEIGQYQKAVEQWKKGLECAVVNTGEITPKSLGDAYCHLGYYNNAIESYKRVMKRNIAMTYIKPGVASREKENFEESIKSCKESLSIAQKIEDREVEIKANFFLGSTYRELVQPDKAIGYYAKSLEISQEVDNKEGARCSLLNLGLLYKMLGKLQNAISCFKQSLNICRQVRDRDGEAACLVNLGITSKMLGEYNEASKYYKESLGIYIDADDKEGEGVVYMNLGCVKWASGEYLDANENFEKALTLFEENDYKKRRIEVYVIIGAFYTEIGKYKEAIEINKKSLKLSEETENRKGENNAKKELVTLYLRDSKFLKAKECLESLNFELIENDKAEAQSFYYDLGATFKHMGKPDNALEFFKMSLDSAEKLRKRDAEGNTYRELGDTCSLMENFDDAIKYCEKSLNVAKEIKDKIIEASTYRTLGLVYRRRSNFYAKKNDEKNRLADNEQSVLSLNKALDLCDLVFDNLKDKDDFKVSIVDTYLVTYDELVSVLIENQEFEKALLMCDRGRARALGALLVKKYNLISNPHTARCGKLEIDDVQKLLQKSNYCVLQFALYKDLAVVWVISQKNEQISIQLETIAVNTETLQSEKWQLDDINLLCSQAIAAVYRTIKSSESTKCENRSMDFLKIDQGEETDNIAFAEVKETMYVSSVKRDTTPDEEESDCGEQETDPLELLYSALLDSALKNVKQDEVVIIPHGHLYEVPFAALKDPQTKRFLSEHKCIRLAPSLTTLKSIQDCPDSYHCKTGALIIGDPDVQVVKLSRLSSAQREAEMIAKILNVKPLTGSEPTKEIVKRKLQEGVAVIHIAAHGDSENGNIALAPPTQTGETSTSRKQDYMLTMQEVQEIDIKAQLVILSCCHSGRGEIRAEGIVGMSRAFLAAGARAVVASLWAINDEATLSFMTSFYTYLMAGESASKSLKEAMDEVRLKYKEPKYWALFFLIGDDVTISL